MNPWVIFLIMFVTFVLSETVFQSILKIKMTTKLHILCLAYEVFGFLWGMFVIYLGVD